MVGTDERLYQAYRRERDSGLEHAEIAKLGLFEASEVDAYRIRFDQAAAAYANAMIAADKVAIPAPRDDFDPYFGRRLSEGNT